MLCYPTMRAELAAKQNGRKTAKLWIAGRSFEGYVLLHIPGHTHEHAPSLKKNLSTNRYDSGGWCWKGRRKKGGHLFTTVSLPQSHTNTKAHAFSGSQRTFGASCRGLSVSCLRRGPSVAFQSLVRQQEILKSSDVSIRFDLEKRVKCSVSDVLMHLTAVFVY